MRQFANSDSTSNTPLKPRTLNILDVQQTPKRFSNRCMMIAFLFITFFSYVVIQNTLSQDDMSDNHELQKWQQYLDRVYEKEKNNTQWYQQSQNRDRAQGTTFVDGGWHYLRSGNIEMCSIEKIGCKQWREVFRDPRVKQGSERPFRFVFYRDPLERFLSGFIDKCITRHVLEGHCEPNVLFKNMSSNFRQNLTSKQLFHMYTETFPLKWNLHFMPMVEYCSSWKRESYDFVGVMDRNFYTQAKELYEKLPSEGFKASLKTHISMEGENTGKETKSVNKIEEYFSVGSIKRLLKYYSRDYKELNLPLPQWLEKYRFDVDARTN